MYLSPWVDFWQLFFLTDTEKQTNEKTGEEKRVPKDNVYVELGDGS